MASKMVSNVKSLTSAVGELTKQVNDLYKSLDKVSNVASKAMQKATGTVSSVGGQYGLTQATTRPGTGADSAHFTTEQTSSGQNRMQWVANAFSMMGGYPGFGQYGPSRFPYPGMPAFGFGGMNARQAATYSMGATAVNFGMGLASGAYQMMPGLSDTMNRTYGYYRAALTVPGISRANLERATFSGMAGGISAPGSDAQVAAALARMGYTPGSQNYLQTVGQVGGAYKYLGMSNEAAAQAIGGFQQGPMAANLFQYGISTFDPSTGKEKTTGQIARELMNYMTGGTKVTTEQVRQSFQRGALGANLRTMGFSEDQQSMLYQAMIDLSSGRNPDLQNASPVKGNENTFLTAQGRINASTTDVMMSAEQKMIKGFENAADTVEMFNRNLKNAADALGYIVGYSQGVSGTPAGKGAGKIGKTLLGGAMMAVGALTSVEGVGVPLMIAGAGVMGSGGGNTGYGAAFGVGNRSRRGGGSPASGAGVTAGYGATDTSSGSPWASTNGMHTGMDYAMPVGTPVKAAFDGVVSAVDLNADYGTSIMIDNADGTQAIYAHLSEKRVSVGDQVTQGQTIGKSGESGNAYGPHLHFEIRDAKNHPVDPSSILSGDSYAGKLFGSYASVNPTAESLIGSKTTSTTTSGVTRSILGTGDQQAWAKDFLTRLGKPTSEENVKAITTWMAWEGGHWKNSAHYNPLNTTMDAPGATAMNSVGVKAYTDYEQGMQATLDTIRVAKYGYPAILAALDSGKDFQGVVNAVNSSKWGTHIKGGATTGYGAAVHSPITSSGSRTVNVTLKIDRASEQEALQFAKKVKYYLEHDDETTLIGRS